MFCVTKKFSELHSDSYGNKNDLYCISHWLPKGLVISRDFNFLSTKPGRKPGLCDDFKSLLTAVFVLLTYSIVASLTDKNIFGSITEHNRIDYFEEKKLSYFVFKF